MAETMLNPELTLSALAEVGQGLDRTPTDPHAACRALIPPRVGARGDFWSKVFRTECCWLWSGATTGGYGVFWVAENKLLRAHRVAYEQSFGPVPPGLDVMHSCDVRRCCRPEHLEAGTRAKNQRDMVIRHRNAPQVGELNHHARLSEVDVRMIHDLARLGYRHADLAARFVTSEAYIGRIVSGRTWPHVAAVRADGLDVTAR